MVGSASDYCENKFLEHLVGKTSWTMPTAYLCLVTTLCTDASTGTLGGNEVPNSGSYARKSTAGADWNAAASGSISNANAITFVTATGSWGTVVGWAICDSGTWNGGNMLAWGDVTVSKTIASGDTASFSGGTPGSLVINCD